MKTAERRRTGRLQGETEITARPAAQCEESPEALPASAHPMDVLRTGVSIMGCVLPEKRVIRYPVPVISPIACSLP